MELLDKTFWDQASPRTSGRFPSDRGCAWLVATRARHGAEHRPSIILIGVGAIVGRCWWHFYAFLVDVDKSCRTAKEETTKRRHPSVKLP